MNFENKKQIKLIIGLIISLLAVIFVVINTNPVKINFGFFAVKLPLIVILVLMVIIGILLGYFLHPEQQKENK